MIRKTHSAGWYRHGKYYFDPEGEAFGNNILENVGSANTDLVIIDEVGPVELKGKGWAKSIENLVSRKDTVQLWVVRKHLLKKVFRQWKIGDILVLDVGNDDLDDAINACIMFMRSHNKEHFVNL